MKKFIFTLFIVSAFAFNGVSQAATKLNATKQLQANKWFVQGAFDGKTLILTGKANDAATWEAKFSTTGQMHNCSTTKSAVIDPSGVEIKSGTYYCDSLYTYKVKNDIVQINYMPQGYFYKIKALANNAGYELTPAIAADFK